MTDPDGPPTDNQPYFEWPAPDGPAREVWYGLVAHPDEPVAFWYRYTLVSAGEGEAGTAGDDSDGTAGDGSDRTAGDDNAGGDGDPAEARVWAALTDGRCDSTAESATTFVAERFDLTGATVDASPFELMIGDDARLRSDAAVGRIESSGGDVAWSLAYEPDELTFTPIRDEALMLEAAEGMGTGLHWSPNQSVEMRGEVTVGDATWSFDGAPGHQGHTASATAPRELTWVHCNAFEGSEGSRDDEPVAFEALSIADRLLPVCLRLPDETHLLNRQETVFGDAVETVANEPGSWTLRGETDAVTFEARIEADGPWQRASYLVPDGSLRYNAHCSLAAVELDVTTDGGHRSWSSDRGRVEWVASEPPVAGAYPPFDDGTER